MSMGQRIAQSRKAKGLSQRAFADKLSVSRSLVPQWESDKKMPGRDNLAKIAQCCTVTMEYLLGVVTAPPPMVIKSGMVIDDFPGITMEELARLLWATYIDKRLFFEPSFAANPAPEWDDATKLVWGVFAANVAMFFGKGKRG